MNSNTERDGSQRESSQRGLAETVHESDMERKSTHNDHPNFVRLNYDHLAALPQHGLWTGSVPDVPMWVIRECKRRGFVTEETRVRCKQSADWNSSEVRALWRMTDVGRQAIKQYNSEQRPMQMPCGHTGFTNEGEYLRCKDCGGRFSRAEVTETER